MGLFGKKKTSVPEIPVNASSKSTFTSSINIPLSTPTPPVPQPAIYTPTSAPSIPTPQPATTIPIIPIPASTPVPTLEEMPTITAELNIKPETRITGQEQPFFVRIDKFNETKENFEKVNQKIQELEKVLHSLEMTKDEEEKEIKAWKEDVIEMKSYLAQIDKEIFSKI